MTDQDPLPEPTWTFRRWFTYGATLLSLGGIGWIIHKLSDGEHLAGVAYGLLGLCAVLATYYLIAPSAEAVVKLIEAASIIRGRRD